MTETNFERVVATFSDLAEGSREALAPFLNEAEILEIVTAGAHGVVETSVSYLRSGKVHEIVYDETTRKILGGNEPAVIDQVVAVLPESGRQTVRDGGRIHKIKIKHDDADDREYVHVHYIDDSGNIVNRKLELDGSRKREAA